MKFFRFLGDAIDPDKSIVLPERKSSGINILQNIYDSVSIGEKSGGIRCDPSKDFFSKRKYRVLPH